MSRHEVPKPEESSVEASAYAGQEPECENKSVMRTAAGRKVMVLQYLKETGVYVVMNLDDAPGTRSPAYKVSPDQLQKIENTE